MNLLEKNIEKFSILKINSDDVIKNPRDYSIEIKQTTPAERYTRRFNAFIPQVNQLTNLQKNCLNEFSLSLEHIDRALKPFSDNGIDYNLALAGGAVRDFILEKQHLIKDHDIFVSFFDKESAAGEGAPFAPQMTPHIIQKILGESFEIDKNYYNALVEEDRRLKYERKIKYDEASAWEQRSMSQQQDPKIGWLENEINKYMVAGVVEKLLQKSNQIDKVYSGNNNILSQALTSQVDYLNNQMYGNIKISNSKLAKPVDLVLCASPPFIFTTSFDFSFCKALVNFKDMDKKFQGDSYQTFSVSLFDENKEGWENVYDNMLFYHTFLKDLEDNTISLNLKNFTPEHIDYFMNKHFVKMKEKYPDRTFNSIEIKEPSMQEYFQHIYMKMNLDFELPESKNKKQLVKI